MSVTGAGLGLAERTRVWSRYKVVCAQALREGKWVLGGHGTWGCLSGTGSGVCACSPHFTGSCGPHGGQSLVGSRVLKPAVGGRDASARAEEPRTAAASLCARCRGEEEQAAWSVVASGAKSLLQRRFPRRGTLPRAVVAKAPQLPPSPWLPWPGLQPRARREPLSCGPGCARARSPCRAARLP